MRSYPNYSVKLHVGHVIEEFLAMYPPYPRDPLMLSLKLGLLNYLLVYRQVLVVTGLIFGHFRMLNTQ